MKIPGQRSGFHICDILDLNNDPKGVQNDSTTAERNGENQSHQTTNQTTLGSHGGNLLGAAPYLPTNVNSSMFADPHHYPHVFSTATGRIWPHHDANSNDHYGKLSIFIFTYIKSGVKNSIKIQHFNIFLIYRETNSRLLGFKNNTRATGYKN